MGVGEKGMERDYLHGRLHLGRVQVVDITGLSEQTRGDTLGKLISLVGVVHHDICGCSVNSLVAGLASDQVYGRGVDRPVDLLGVVVADVGGLGDFAVDISTGAGKGGQVALVVLGSAGNGFVLDTTSSGAVVGMTSGLVVLVAQGLSSSGAGKTSTVGNMSALDALGALHALSALHAMGALDALHALGALGALGAHALGALGAHALGALEDVSTLSAVSTVGSGGRGNVTAGGDASSGRMRGSRGCAGDGTSVGSADVGTHRASVCAGGVSAGVSTNGASVCAGGVSAGVSSNWTGVSTGGGDSAFAMKVMVFVVVMIMTMGTFGVVLAGDLIEDGRSLLLDGLDSRGLVGRDVGVVGRGVGVVGHVG